MAYRFKISEPFDEGVRRIGVEQIDRALDALREGSTPAKSVHETRKALKRIRALLRLSRPGLSSHSYETENARYRDIGRLMAGARDRHVLVETIGKFQTASAGKTKTAFAAVLAKLKARERDGQTPDEAAVAAEAIVALEEARDAMADLAFKSSVYGVAWDGIERTYKQAVEAFERAYDGGDDEAMHEWRKRVQHHWRHMALFRDAWPEMTLARVQAAKSISDMLGEDHDISVMLFAIDDPAYTGSGRGRRGALNLGLSQRKITRACATERQAEMRAICHVLGQRLFAEPAGAFADRMRHYWASAHEIDAPSGP